MKNKLTQPKRLLPSPSDCGSFPLVPLVGFAVFLGLSSALLLLPTAGLLVVGLLILACAVGFVARQVRRDRSFNDEMGAAWAATQPRPPLGGRK